MNRASPSQCPQSLPYAREWLLIFVAVGLFFLIVDLGVRNVSKRAAIDIYLDTNGMPTIFKIPLGNGSVRDVTLRTLSRAKVAVRVVVPSGGSAASGWDTNSVQTLNAIIKAGLIPTNKPSGPSRYE